MKKLWLIFIAIFVFSFAILGWVGTEIFRQAPPIPCSAHAWLRSNTRSRNERTSGCTSLIAVMQPTYLR